MFQKKSTETFESNSNTLAKKKEEVNTLVSNAKDLKSNLIGEKEREANIKKVDYSIESQNVLKKFNVENLFKELYRVTKQAQLQQLAVLETARSNGVSGIKQIKTQNGKVFFCCVWKHQPPRGE